ncbi:hypothetical protein [Treponema brennaborense]|uniref:Uncharacterized protein n=1 Tax=Treponema brennaborense (strain DSM 12168 / CIP 105900 / DD5/3) TaxID=906968 RepID=F4LNH3_TREBD|nr:hypothetical protein [Treponema brennaborense]AEE15827.1 hypothetical protein Trebr_0380 [Treponema brennaborense DSM 12168]
MRKCNAVFNGIVVSLLTVCAAFMYTTCEVGLGNSVDTQPPAVTIAYPPEAAVIRGQFVVNGTASDETFVKSVAVVFTSTEQESKTYGPYQAEINKESKTWAVRLNAQDASSGSYAIPDGKYAVTVTAADSASRTSVATTVYEIDNTAPVLYVQRPGSRDETSPDTYGSSVSVSGQVYDAHLISKLTFSVFEKNPDGSFSRKGGKTIENVAPNISVVLADFDDDLDSLYTSLYGSDKNAGEKTFYCTVSVEDEARPYTGSADTSGGNKSAGYYLYDEVSALVSAKDLYTARSSGSLLADGVETSLSAAFISTTDETDVKGVFSLDPAVSPKWTVINLSVFETGYLDTDAYKVPAGSSLTIRVEPSLNNSAIVDDSLAVYVQRCDRSGTVSAGAEKIYLMKKADDCTPEERIERKNAIKTVGSNRTLTINSLAALPVNTAYRLFAEGTDAALNIVAAANDAQYGFFLEGNGAPPEITLDGLSYYTNPAGQFSLSGSCTSQTGDSVTLIIALSGGSYLKETTVNSGAAWNFPFTAAELLAKAEETGAIDRTKSKTYSLEVRAQSGISTTAIKNCSVYYDAENPIPEIASVTPQVSANGKDTNVNGVILCKGTASDEDKVETSVLKLYTSADGASGWTPVAWTAGGGVVSVPNGAVNDAMRFCYAVDTKAVDSAGAAVFGDKKYLKLEIVSTDRSGNTGAAELVLYVDQSTDNPVVSYFNVSGTNTLFGYSGNNTILGTITDDDGLASVELYVDAETVPRKTFVAAVLQGTKSKAFEYDIFADIPAGAAALAEGSHELYFKITDTENGSFDSAKQLFVVDTAVPLIAVTAPVSGGFAGKDVTVKGTASDTRGVAKVEYKQIDTASGAVTWTAVTPKTAAADGSAADWSEWSYPITGQADTGAGAGYTRVFRATDLSGRTAETSVTYKVDTISPAFGLKLKFSGYSQDDYPGLSGSERVWLTATAQTLSGTMTEVNPGQINFTVTGATDASGAVSAVAGTNSPFRTTIMFEEGESSVTFTSQDTAGNAAIPLSRSVYVDATPPVLSDVSLPDMDDSRHITNGGADIIVKLTASDAVSGVNAGSAASKVVELGSGAGFKTAVFSGWLTAIPGDENENRYRLTVPAETIRALGNGVHTLYIRVADKAGNKSEIALPELTVDLDAPTVSYTTPAANSVVNKKITLKGTVSDANLAADAAPALYVWNPAISDWHLLVKTGDKNDKHIPYDIEIAGLDIQPVSTGSEWTVGGFDTDAAGLKALLLASDGSCKLQVRFTDRAGNPPSDTAAQIFQPLLLTVDQSTDNPVVSYFNVSGTNTLFGYSGNNTILGTITDDDGLASVELYVDAETVPRKTFAAAVLQGTKSKAFEYDIFADIPAGAAALAEGSHELYFKITDTENGSFDSAKQPFVVDTAVPLIAVTAPVSGGFAGKDVTVKGTASDTRGVAKVEYKQIDTASGAVTWTAVTPKTAAADGSAADWSEWSYPITGQADTGAGAGYTRVFRATDLSGRTAETSVTYKVDTISPAFGLKLKFSGYSQDDYPGLSGGERVWLMATAQTLSGTMTEVNPGQINFTVTGATDASGAVSAVAGTDSPFRTTIMFEEGESSVTFTSQDTAGNAAIPLSRSVYVDATPPVLSDVSLSGTDVSGSDSRHITNGGADITVKLTASDAVSGVNAGSAASKVVELGSGAGFKTAVFSGWLTAISGDENENRYTLTVPAETIRALGNGVHTLYVRVADKAGNKSEIALPELTVDLDAPTVSYTTPAANSVVNKKITLKGTVSDANLAADAAPALYVWNPAILDWQSVGASGSGCAIEIAGLDIQPVSTGSEWTVGGFDTAADGLKALLLASDGSCKLQVRFTDRAGNSPSDTAAQTLLLTVDQHKDRPTVKISNMSFMNAESNGMSEASPVWLKQTRTLFGTVSDDDGACTLQISENGGSFTDVSVDNGSWNYALSADGVRTVVFKVTDSAGTVFTSAAAADDAALLDTPILSDGTHSFGEKGSTGSAADSRLHIKVDTKVPEIRTVKWQRPSDSQWLDTFPTEKFGGTRTAATLRVTAWDDNGIKSVVFLKSGTAISTLTSPSGTLSADEGGADYWSASVPTNSGDGYQEVTIKVTDTADLETTRTVQINVDNTAPVVSIDSHKSGEQVNGEIVLKGTTDGAASLRYAVASSDSAAIDWNTASAVMSDSFISWRIYFDGKSVTGETHGLTMNGYLVSLGITTDTAIKDNSYANLTDLFVYLRAVDECGNVNDVQPLKLVVDPQGDRPKVVMTYPDHNDETLGGTIRMTGTAEDNSKVSAVYVQIDPDYNGVTVAPKLAQSDWNTVNTKFGTSYTLESFGSGTAVQTGFKTTGTLSWNFNLNTKGEFDPSGDGTRRIALRVYAVDDGGNISQPYERIITVDKDTPLIGSSEKLYLRKYANSDGSGTPIASVEYTDGMWINGSWYLEGSVEDASGIKDLTVTNPGGAPVDHIVTASDDTSGTLVDPAKATAVESNGAFGVNSGYRIKIPVGSETDSFGMLEYTIRATEGTSKNLFAEKTIRLNYDNKAPVIRQPGASGFNISDSVVNSNGFYTLGSAVNEDGSGLDSQSGFSRVVFYFERTLNDVTSIYDPLLKPANAANKVNQTDLRSEDGLWWKVKTVTRDSNLLTALTLDSSDENIRSGGIVKIGGAIYRITNVSGTAVTIDGSPVVSETEALFAVAQVADNLTTETPNTASLKNENGYYPVVNDDGDGMVEGVTKIGTEYVWEASINSKNIPDGPVTIRYVVFDKAGNHTVGSVSGTVSNNRPRIAGVSFGTDDNGNGIVDDTEFNSAWSGLYANSQAGLPNGYSSSNTKVHELNVQQTNGMAVLKIKGKTVVRPEIVGGNNSLAYTYTVTKKGVTDPYYTQTVPVSLSTEHSDSDDIRTGLSDIALTVKDFLSAGTTGTEITDADDQRFSFTLWDATDGTVQGQNSQYARINMVMDVALRDTVSPTASIRPFYWNGKSDNSLYLNSLENGHIELGSDLPADSFKDSGTGVNDRDPKVSGKVVVTGTANDNNLLSELYIKIPGLTDSGTDGYKRIAYRDGTSGSWTAEGTLDADGWQFVAESDTFSQTAGNTVTWKLYWDTAKITNRAAADVEVRVRAVDRGTVSLSGDILKYTPNAPSAESNVQTKDDALTSYYRVDVVPYVSKLTTNLSKLKSNNPSVYNRTALGRYPVNATETVSIAGFNLEGADVGGTSATGESYANGVVTVPVTSMKTGALELTVNGIGVLNNRNSNTAEYNKQPNGDNNNLLTDDVELDVWEFNSSAARTNRGLVTDPVMRINPVNDIVGFAFANGPDYFSMSDGQSNSYTLWQRNYDDFAGTSFIYDSAGVSHGTNVGRDINSSSNHAGKFVYLTSRWGISGINGQGGNYGNTNSLRMESLGQSGSPVILDKSRIRSPSLASVRHGSSTSLYLAYYDDINQEIRFRYGALADNSSHTNFGQFYDEETDNAVSAVDYSHVSLIAGGNTGQNPGEYVSLAIVPGATADKDVAVVVWYDALSQKLLYSYNTSAATDRSGDKSGTGWSSPLTIYDQAGEHCQVTVDVDKGIHIAAYETTGADLIYAYLPSYESTEIKSCIVDSYGIVGTYITIDTAKNVDDKVIPYIGYYMASSIRPKLAYLVNTAEKAPAGTNLDAFTGNWEITLLPTTSTMLADRINVGVWKMSTGVLKNSVTGNSTSTATSGTCYGNGTANPVLGYAIKTGTTGFIETAQKR